MENLNRFGGWWPFKQISEAFGEFERETDRLMGAVFGQVESALTAARQAALDAGKSVEDLDKQLASVRAGKARLGAELDNARKLAPGSSRLALVANVTKEATTLLDRGVKAADTGSSDAGRALDAAVVSADRALQLIAAVDQNPARRIAGRRRRRRGQRSLVAPGGPT